MIRKVLEKSKSDRYRLTPGETTILKLHNWIKVQDKKSILALDHNGKINKQKLKAQTGINPRAVQNQNPKASKLMRRMERHWRSLGLLSPLTPTKICNPISHTSSSDHKSSSTHFETQDPRDAEIKRLKNEVCKLQALLYQKEIELSRYEEFKDVLFQEGFFQ